MTDIVERLTSAAKPLQHMGNEEEELAAAAMEAADEIARMRETIRRMEETTLLDTIEIEKLRAEIEGLRAEAATSPPTGRPIFQPPQIGQQSQSLVSGCSHGS